MQAGPEGIVVTSREDLLGKILPLVQEHWAEHQRPLMLSQIGNWLRDNGIDYRALLDGGSIAQYLREHEDKVTVVQHSRQHAKIGAVPAGENYSFEESEGTVRAQEEYPPDLIHSRRAFYHFVKAISALPAEDMERIVIPTRVIVRLLEGK